MTQSDDLEARYRVLLRVYPLRHRIDHADEIVATLLDVARPGQRWPDPREAFSLVRNGLATRARSVDELGAGLRVAGLWSLALATMLAGSLTWIAALPSAPPPAGRVGIGRDALVPWGLVLLAVGLSSLDRRHRWRVVPVIAVALGTVIAGADLMGPRRTLLLPCAVFLAGATLSGRARIRDRVAAVAAGAVAGAWLAHRYVDQFGDAGWGPSKAGPLWVWVDRWVLTYRLVPLSSGAWLGMVIAGLTAGLVRLRYGVATLAVAVPLGWLTIRDRYDPDVVGVVAVAVIAAFALGASTVVASWIRPSRAAAR